MTTLDFKSTISGEDWTHEQYHCYDKISSSSDKEGATMTGRAVITSRCNDTTITSTIGIEHPVGEMTKIKTSHYSSYFPTSFELSGVGFTDPISEDGYDDDDIADILEKACTDEFHRVYFDALRCRAARVSDGSEIH
jgi:hypothetical protein